jgi:FAD/FMN-containing dehydrogenase
VAVCAPLSLRIDRRVIVRVADADDVARVIAIARDGGLPLAVRGGGYSLAGHGVCDDGVVLGSCASTP